MKILLNAEEIVKLDENDDSCENDAKWTKCIMEEGSKFVGCSLNWFKNDSDYPACETVEEMKKMQEFFRSVKVKGLRNLNCRFPCSSKDYKVQSIVETPITWRTPWLSEVIFDLGSLVYEKKKEYYIYDKVSEESITYFNKSKQP